MNYQQIFKDDLINGTGVRISIFVSGCNFKCKGCYSPQSWEHDSGLEFTDEIKNDIFKEINDKSYLDGISFLGGDPLTRKNYKDVIRLSKEFKEHFPTKSIWLWSGFTLEQIQRSYCSDILKYLDVLVDGRFEEDKKDLTLPFRGSSNQRVLFKGTDF